MNTSPVAVQVESAGERVYQVLLERAAERELRRLPDNVHQKCVVAIRRLSGDPRPPGCRKLTGSTNDWRIRVGDYRIVYEIADAIRIVRVHRVRHRRDVYR